MITPPIYRYVVEVLSRLVSHAGSKALGRRHLVEITRIEELHHLNFFRVETQLQEAAAALATIITFFDKGCIKKTAFDSLVKIYPPFNSQDLIQCALDNHPESILTV
jgi:hypothetical protein